MQASNAISFDGLDLASLADSLAPLIAARLWASAPGEARELAKDAVSVPGLEPFALSAMADWLEDRQYPELAGRVRRMIVSGGDLLAVTVPTPMTASQMETLRASLEPIKDFLAKTGREVMIIIMQNGMTLQNFCVTATKNGTDADQSRDYEATGYCDICDRDTRQRFHDDGHERDSSGDRRECLECGAKWHGFTGTWSFA